MPRALRGEANPMAKLTEAQAKEILVVVNRHRQGLPIPKHFIRGVSNLNATAIAREFKVSPALVQGIISGRNWAWLNEGIPRGRGRRSGA